MNARNIIDHIFEAEEGAKSPDSATVKIELVGSPKQVQKAIRQLAEEKVAGVKIKGPGGETIKPDEPVKIDKGEKKEVKGKDKDDKGKGKDNKSKEKDEDLPDPGAE